MPLYFTDKKKRWPPSKPVQYLLAGGALLLAVAILVGWLLLRFVYTDEPGANTPNATTTTSTQTIELPDNSYCLFIIEDACQAHGALYKGRKAGTIGDCAAFSFNQNKCLCCGEGGMFVGYKPTAGEEIVIVEDVITAGTAIRESMEILSVLEGVKISAVFVMVDRKEKGKTEKSAMQELSDEYGFPVYSVVDVYDIIEYLEEDPANEENVTRIKNYLSVNGAKV